MNRTMVVFNLIYIAFCVVGLAIFAVIFLSTRKGQREKPMSVSKWKKRENVWFFVVLVALIGALAATITYTPWNAAAQANRQVAVVTAQQFAFVFVSVDGTPVPQGQKATFEAGRQVEFRLHSPDVNHAFAVFDPDGAIVGQAQVMPGWDGTLRLTMRKPGTYTVKCYEYCGLGHHQMISTFEVKA
jgi:cytochrome c oxidase subunit 2